jgi:hypothetical protein
MVEMIRHGRDPHHIAQGAPLDHEGLEFTKINIILETAAETEKYCSEEIHKRKNCNLFGCKFPVDLEKD